MKLVYASDTNLKTLESFENKNDKLEITDVCVVDYAKFPIFFSGNYNLYFDDLKKKDNKYLSIVVKLETISLNFKRALEGEVFNEKKIYEDLKIFIKNIYPLIEFFDSIFISSFSTFYVSNLPETFKLNSDFPIESICIRANLLVLDLIKEKINFFQIPHFYNHFLPLTKRDKLFLISKNIYFQEELKKLEFFVMEQISFLKLSKIKLIILDLDNTIWGGVVGEDGINNLKLGGHDSVGECYVQIQKCFKYFKKIGVLLAIVSKNNENIALEAIAKHPEMRLNIEDFVDYKINWDEKSLNIIDIVQDLNIGMDSVLFIDDNPIEREKVKINLEKIHVFDFPQNIYDVPNKLTEILELYPINLTNEDKNKTKMYKENISRNNAINSKFTKQNTFEGLQKFLNLKVSFDKITRENINRVNQLLNKTNQFTLTGKNFTKKELEDFLLPKDINNFVISAKDNFGDYGLISVLIYKKSANLILVKELVMSCRILGRGIENEILKKLNYLSKSSKVLFELKKTGRNDVMVKFLNEEKLDFRN